MHVKTNQGTSMGLHSADVRIMRIFAIAFSCDEASTYLVAYLHDKTIVKRTSDER